MDQSTDNLSFNKKLKSICTSSSMNSLNNNFMNNKYQFYNSDNLLFYVNSKTKTDTKNSSNNYLYETSGISLNSLDSSPSSVSVDNSIECRTKKSKWSTKVPSFIKLNLQSNKTSSKYSMSPENNFSIKKNEDSFKYLNSSLRNKNNLENINTNSFKRPKNPLTKYSVDNLALSASSRCVSQNKQLKKTFVDNSSKKINSTQEKNLDDDKNNQPNNLSLTKHDSSSSLDFKNFTSTQKITLFCILTVSFCSYCSMSILGPFFPFKASQKGLTETQSGLIFSVFALISVIFSPFLGKIVPYFGIKFMILFGIFLSGVSNLIFGLLEDVEGTNSFFYFCMLTRMMESFGTCCHSTASYTYVITLFPNAIGFVFGLTETSTGIALCLGPAIGSFIYSYGGYKLPFYIFGCLLLMCLPFNWYFLDNITEENSDTDSKTLSNTSKKDIETTYWKIIRVPKIFVICVVIIVMSLSESFLESTYEPHLRVSFGLSPELVGVEFLLGSVTYAVSTLVVGYVSNRIDNKFSIMLGGTLVTLLGLLMVGPSKFFYFAPKNIWFCTIGYLLIQFHGIAFIPTFESIFDHCLEYGFKDDIETYGKISGLWSCLFSLGEVIGPALGGYITNHYGFQYTSTVIACICMFTVPFLIIMCFKENCENAKKFNDVESIFDKQTSFNKLNKPKSNSMSNLNQRDDKNISSISNNSTNNKKGFKNTYQSLNLGCYKNLDRKD